MPDSRPPEANLRARPPGQPPAAMPPQPVARPVAHPAPGFAGAPVEVTLAPLRWIDVVLAVALALVAAAAAVALPAGPLRYALVLPLLLFAPGYLLLQALVVPPARGAARFWHALVAVGLSPPLVGLLALSTSVVEGGFRPAAILAMVSLGSLALGIVALVRRRAAGHAVHVRTAPDGRPEQRPVPAGRRPEAARAKTGPVRP